MSNRHQQSRRRAYGRRQRELRTRRPADWELELSPFTVLEGASATQARDDDSEHELLARFTAQGLRTEAIA